VKTSAVRLVSVCAHATLSVVRHALDLLPRYSHGGQPFQVGWKELFQKLTMIDRSNIAKVAQDLVDESVSQRRIVTSRASNHRSSGD
jgi:hypothetical protein